MATPRRSFSIILPLLFKIKILFEKIIDGKLHDLPHRDSCLFSFWLNQSFTRLWVGPYVRTSSCNSLYIPNLNKYKSWKSLSYRMFESCPFQFIHVATNCKMFCYQIFCHDFNLHWKIFPRDSNNSQLYVTFH